MMKWKVYFAILALVMPLYHAVQAATLTWDAQTIVSPLAVERSATETGTYTAVATLPTGATSYILTPGAYGWYRVSNSAGPSNVVQFSLDLYTGPVTQRLDTLEAHPTLRLSDGPPAGDTRLLSCVSDLLEPPTMTCYPISPTLDSGTTPPAPSIPSNLTIRHIDPDHIEITCNGIGISTTGSGTRRFMECRH
jgi:hypothetical protein